MERRSGGRATVSGAHRSLPCLPGCLLCPSSIRVAGRQSSSGSICTSLPGYHMGRVSGWITLSRFVASESANRVFPARSERQSCRTECRSLPRSHWLAKFATARDPSSANYRLAVSTISNTRHTCLWPLANTYLLSRSRYRLTSTLRYNRCFGNGDQTWIEDHVYKY